MESSSSIHMHVPSVIVSQSEVRQTYGTSPYQSLLNSALLIISRVMPTIPDAPNAMEPA